MDRLQAMSTFVAVVDSGGFASAARKLGMSPPAVTRAVADLEARLGVRLLTRTTRVVRVTEAGARFADDCRRILAEVGDAETTAAGTHAAPRGTLTVTAPVLFGELVVTPVVVEYLQRHPEVDAQCLFVDRVVNLVEDGVDVAVRIGELPDSSLRAVRVGQVRRVLVAAPAYLQRHGVPQQPQDLTAHTLISASTLTPVAEWRFGHGERLRQQRVQPRLRTTSNGAARAAAVAGLGIARLLSYQVAEALGRGELQLLLADFESPALPVHVVHHEGRHAAQKVRGFVDLAVQRLRGLPALA